MSGKQQQIATLEQRLQDGFEKIGKAMQEGIEVANWEWHWIELLQEYERLTDELHATKPAQAEMPLGRIERAA